MTNSVQNRFDSMRINSDIFLLCDHHIKLLNRASIMWDNTEFGAPAIDGKRPYGNSNVYADIAEILNIVDAFNDDGEFWEDEYGDWFDQVHAEVGLALQIILVTGKMEPGCYRKARKYDYTSWYQDYKLL